MTDASKPAPETNPDPATGTKPDPATGTKPEPATGTKSDPATGTKPEPAPAAASRRRGRPPEGVREAILAATLDLAAEQGLARLTTKEVARRAGASEASVFYHFGDKVGLLQAALVAGMEPLMELDPAVAAGAADETVGESLLAIAVSLERFFGRVLPILGAIQGDSDLRTAFGERMAERDLGPHRGVELLGRSLAGMQRRGLVDPAVDGEAVAPAIIGACLLHAWLRYLFGPGPGDKLPSLAQTVGAMAGLLETPGAAS